MKKTGLKAACLLLIWVLLWAAAGLVYAEEAVPAGEAETAPRNIIILPFTNAPNLYPVADPQSRFLDTFSGLLQLMPADGSVLYSVFPQIAENDVTGVSSPVKAAAHISMERKQNAEARTQIARIKNLELKENDILFVLDCSTDYDQSNWRGLTDLLESGVHICFIEIQNERNQNKKNNYAQIFSLTEITPNQFQEAGNISFCWMDNADNPLDTLLPVMQPLSGTKYEKAGLNEEGIFAIQPYVLLTEKTRLLLQWKDSLAVNGIDSVQTESAGELVYGNGAFGVIDIPKGASYITVPASAANSVYFLTEETTADQYTLMISKTTDKEFLRNEKNIYEVTLQGSGTDASVLERDLESHDVQMTLKREEDSAFAAPVTWDENEKKWTATVTYDRGGTWTVYAEADLGGGHVFKSSIDTANVQNHTPVVELDASLGSTADNPAGTAENPIKIWVNNPWDESSKDMVSIPLHINDEDKDSVTLLANGEAEHFVTNLGKVSFSEIADGNARMIITLNKVDGNQKIDLDTPFTVTVQASDGEVNSEPVEITFMLQDLSAELGKVSVSGLTVSDPQTKKQEFDVFFTVDASACSDPDRLLAVLKEHAAYQIVLSDEDTRAMQQKAGTDEYHITLRFDDPGERTLTVTESSDLPVPDVKTIRIEGSRPAIGKRPQDLEEEIEKDGDALKWDSSAFSGKNLFTDADKDNFTVTVSVTDADKHSYTLKPVGNGTGPAIYEVRSGKQEEPVEIPGEQSFKLRFTEEGSFTVKFTATDVDGKSDPVSMNIQLMTRWNRILGLVKKYAPYAAAGIVLILILAYLLKPSFKGKTAQMTVTTADAEQTTEIPLDEWKKGKKPFWQLLTCASFPPEPEAFEKVSKVQVKPARKGMKILKAADLTGRKHVTVDADHPLTVQVGETNLTITVK